MVDLYCYTSGYHFQLDQNKKYGIDKTETRQLGSGVWAFDLHLNPQSSDPIAMFDISCMTSTLPSFETVKQGLSGVYEVISE